MAKLLIIAAAILAVAISAPVERKRVPIYKLLAPRDPFPDVPSDSPIVPATISLLTIEQRVDNFNPLNLDTWEQRYYRNNYYYTPGSPIFVFLAGEWTITPYRLTNSLMVRLMT